MTKQQIIKQFIEFVSASPTPFHAVRTIAETLKKNGFSQLQEKDRWKLEKNGSYFVIRGKSSIVAFKTGAGSIPRNGFRIVGAHTDSPALKIKSIPERKFKNYLTLGVEVYGGAILSSWFDRDLSIAGRVSYQGEDGRLGSALIDFKRPVAVVPNLAIHLSSRKNGKSEINKQNELPALIMQIESDRNDEPFVFKGLLKTELEKTLPGKAINEILDYDLVLYDTQAPARIGFNREFIAGARLDNLLSCFAGLRALVASDPGHASILICNDHEEVGSSSYTGAAGPFLKTVLERILKTREDFLRAIPQSILISADNAHGVHPNYQSRYDENHGSVLNRGPVIKINANQRYATNSETGSFFRHICRQAKVPVQDFINRSDLACGSTIGPITATTLGIETLDIGAPTFAMHSIRETCGTEDIWYMFKALKKLFDTR
ncbi:MAG: M18 family aminopeptidase [Proteobacteria bacterium]|nr:M18 family aminopeptidase [Pseudomonadota bacterium]